MIRPVSAGGVPPNEPTVPAEPMADTSLPSNTADALSGQAGDPLAKLFELIGAAPHQQRLHGNNGGGTQDTQVRQTDPLVGTELPGQKGVVIQRSFGDPKGYDTRNHALAWARAMGSDTAMVVQDKNHRWHAVQTSQAGQSSTKANGAVLNAIQVGKVDPKVYEQLRRDAMADNDPDKWKTFASYALGVPRDEINVVTGNQEPARDKLNINLTRDFDAEGKTAGFDPKKPPWVQLGPAAFDRPANACATLAHEEVHADHHQLAQGVYKDYLASGSKDSFRKWVADVANQVAAKNKSDPTKVFEAFRKADIVAGMVDGTFGATELEAHIEAAKVAFASGDLVQARTDLNKVATRPTMPTPQTQEVSIALLKDLRASLSGDALKVFDEVAKKAPERNVLHDGRLRPR